MEAVDRSGKAEGRSGKAEVMKGKFLRPIPGVRFGPFWRPSDFSTKLFVSTIASKMSQCMGRREVKMIDFKDTQD